MAFPFSHSAANSLLLSSSLPPSRHIPSRTQLFSHPPPHISLPPHYHSLSLSPPLSAPLRLDRRSPPLTVTLGLDPQSASRPAVSASFIVILSGTPYRLCQLGIDNHCKAGLIFISALPSSSKSPPTSSSSKSLISEISRNLRLTPVLRAGFPRKRENDMFFIGVPTDILRWLSSPYCHSPA